MMPSLYLLEKILEKSAFFACVPPGPSVEQDNDLSPGRRRAYPRGWERDFKSPPLRSGELEKGGVTHEIHVCRSDGRYLAGPGRGQNEHGPGKSRRKED